MATRLKGSFIEARSTDDWGTVAWRKLILNAPFGGLGVLARTGSAALCSDPSTRQLLEAMVDEMVSVGRAEGADIPNAPALVDEMCSRSSHRMSSIVRDRIAAHPIEWDARNAVVGRIGRKHGILTPVNDQITALMRHGEPAEVELSNRGSVAMRPR
jgi:2-dehydropantoate 2-reductase